MKCKLIVVLLVMLCILAPMPYAMEKGVFQPPSLEGYAREQEWERDGDNDGIKETHFVRYLDRKGNKIVQLSAWGRTWAWIIKSVDYPKDKSDIGKNYVNRDSDCDGLYDERYTNEEEWYLPDCVKDMIKK